MKKMILQLMVFISMMFFLEAAELNSINLPFFTETEHFEIYCNEQDWEVSAVMLLNLEKRFEDITSRYGFIPQSRIRLGIYPDSNSFHEAIGQPEASQWINEFWSDGLILMLSPNAPNPHSYSSRAVLAPIDSFVGCILQGRNAQAPWWLHIGVPLYESGRWIVEEKEFGKRTMQEYIDWEGFPEFEDLENSSNFNAYNSPFATTLVYFIIQTKGFDALLGLLEDYAHFDDIMGQSKASFRDAWIEFLSNTYLNQESF